MGGSAPQGDVYMGAEWVQRAGWEAHVKNRTCSERVLGRSRWKV